MATKAMILNNDFLEFTQTGLIKLFKPTYNPAVGNNFPLQYYPYDAAKNPVKVKYNTPNVVTNLFLVTENFLKFINKINDIWYLDVVPRVITPVTYTIDATYGYTKLLSADTSNTAQLVRIFEEGTANNAAKFAEFEGFAAKGIMGDSTSLGCLSSSIPELFLRHLYSKDKAKRASAFKLARDFYSIPVAEVNAAELEMIPAEDFDSDLFTTTLVDDVLTLSYASPIKFQEKYLETVHNTSNQALYLYFPLITSNAMRQLTPSTPTTDPTKEELHNLISLYSGVTAPTSTTLPTDSNFAGYFKLDTISYRAKNATGGGAVWSLVPPVTNKNMPTLTNTIWSNVKGKNILQAGYTAVSITEAGGGGDVIFDHTDKIEYIDSLTLKIKVPTVYS